MSSSIPTKHQVSAKEHVNKELHRAQDATPNETKMKSSSLPPGLALSQLGQSAAKLTTTEINTPRSSIKRSKSSTQGKPLKDEVQNVSNSESQIHSYNSDNKISSKYIPETKNADETCLEKKTKSEKKSENEATKSGKKEESFFGRLLLRRSGKKPKKDQTDIEIQQDNKKSKSERNVSSPQYKPVDTERPDGFAFGEYVHGSHKPVDKTAHKSAAQRAFSNQAHKRIDNKGAYVHENMYKDVYDLKIAEETDKLLNMKCNHKSEELPIVKIPERTKRSSSKDAIDNIHRESYDVHECMKRSHVPKVVDPYSSKAFITNEQANLNRERNLNSVALAKSLDEEPPIRAPRFRGVHSDYTFNSGSMPKNIPYFKPNHNISASASPPKSMLHQSSENVKKFNRSSEYVSGYNKDRPALIEPCKRVESSQHNFHNVVAKTDSQSSYINSGLRSLGEEYVDTRSSIGKSHSFRYASETNSISSQESQMPSLPAIVGISEPLLESWESNYRRSVSQNARAFNARDDFTQRISARNYNLNMDVNYDSLASTDSSSYMDSLKTESQPEIERKPLFTNNINIKMDMNKRDSDISQIEAKIDDIISSPKPLIPPILKSNSLDSVKSSPERHMDEKRKTISVESVLSNSSNKPSNNREQQKHDAEQFISVTHLNKDQALNTSNLAEPPKVVKSEEKLQKSGGTVLGVPEFLKIQLNKVDIKPTTNIVLTANVTPKKGDTQQGHIEVDSSDITEEKYIKTQNNDNGGQEQPQSQGVGKHIPDDNMMADNAYETKNITDKAPSQQVTPESPSTPKTFFKRKALSVEIQDRNDKSRTNSVSTEGSNEKIYDNISMDRKSHSSFGSKSSIQSTDSNEIRTPDRHEECVVYRKKPAALAREHRGEKRNDDEPELMKVFARRSLKIKDCDADNIAQEIAEINNVKNELVDNISATKSKVMKNEFNASIKSRDSDKENEETVTKEPTEQNRFIDIAARVSQFGVPHYQRSVSVTSVTSASANPKRESAPVYRNEVNKYKKEVSDSTPEKRLRNRTFPDPSNEREDMKSIAAKNEVMGYKADTLSKRPWQKKEDDVKIRHISVEVKDKNQVKNETAVIDKEEEKGNKEVEKEKDGSEGEADASPQFKGILQMRAEWERRAKQGMTK